MPTTGQFTHTNAPAPQLTESLENAIRVYSRFLIDLPTLTATAEIEYAEKEMHELLSMHGKEAGGHELSVIQLFKYLADSYAKKRILEKGIDPYSQEPIVNLEDSHYSF